jgi:hypothetical protein
LDTQTAYWLTCWGEAQTWRWESMTLQEEAKPEAADMAVAMVVVLERSRRLLVVGVAERITRELVARGDWRNLHGATDAAAAAEARAG